MAEGCDISEHQGDLASEWFDQWDYCIIRAFNENGYPDLKFAQNWVNAKGRTLRGVYGWPIPGGNNVALGAQLAMIAPDAEAGYWADVEHSGRGIASADDTEAYLRGIGDRTRGFYSNIGELPRSPFLDSEMWWVANYSVNDGTRHPVNAPRDWVIHQYTSNPLDKNYSPDLAWLGGDNVALELTDFAWLQNNISGQGIDGKTNITNRMVLDAVAALAAKIGNGTASGLDAEDVRAIVRDELDKTRLAH